MAQVILKRSLGSKVWGKVQGIFIIPPASFSTKSRINFRSIGWLLCGFLALFFLVVFLVPEPVKPTRTYHERSTENSPENPAESRTQTPPPQIPFNPSSVHTGVANDNLGGRRAEATNLNTSMIIVRENDSSTTLPPGTKFWVKLAQAATVTSRALPVIGLVTVAVISGNAVAIPEDSKIFGEASLGSDSERAQVTWKSILFPDGRSKPLSALALGPDNQVGIEGSYHSDALKNTAGQLVSRFVGGVAEGAITRTPFGASQGGIQNGLLQGVADTAKDRTDAWSEDLKKPRSWIELESATSFQVILSQPFTFRDPGGLN